MSPMSARQGRHLSARFAFTALRSGAKALSRFGRDDSGATAIIFGIFFTTFMLAAAMAVDFTRVMADKSNDQRALDSAVLAATDALGVDNQNVVAEARARAFYEMNRRSASVSEIAELNVDAQTGRVTGNSEFNWKTSLLKMFYYDGAEISSRSVAAKGNSSVEIALVLDNSGSMAGSSISDLKTAAKDLTATVFAGDTSNAGERIRISVVPFAASVNVGSEFKTAAWMDGDGLNPTHGENFAEAKTRWELFDDLNTGWGGCVEARPDGLDTSDAPAASGNPQSLFVPLFAPDEPGTAGSTAGGFYNSYLDDDGGACPRYTQSCTGGYSRRGNCRGWSTNILPPAEAQARTCKYKNATPSGRYGPNFLCSTQKLLPLTATKTEIDSSIEDMRADGATNIKEGLAWGWRVLSSGAPFTEGRAKTDTNNRKIIVLMTDGENWYNALNDHNKSIYGAHGYGSKGRLGNTHTFAGYNAELNARTLDACTNAKSDSVEIFTVAFRLENDETTTSLLASCASSADHVFKASGGDSLVQAFRDIGKKIQQLHVAG